MDFCIQWSVLILIIQMDMGGFSEQKRVRVHALTCIYNEWLAYIYMFCHLISAAIFKFPPPLLKIHCIYTVSLFFFLDILIFPRDDFDSIWPLCWLSSRSNSLPVMRTSLNRVPMVFPIRVWVELAFKYEHLVPNYSNAKEVTKIIYFFTYVLINYKEQLLVKLFF